VTELDDELVPEVKAILDEFGRTITYTSIARVYDVPSGQVIETPTDFLNVQASPLYNVDWRYMNHDVVRMDDSAMILHNKVLGFTPARADRCTIDGVTWTVIEVKPYPSGLLVCAWELFLRR
jgi:hypothetical protein